MSHCSPPCSFTSTENSVCVVLSISASVTPSVGSVTLSISKEGADPDEGLEYACSAGCLSLERRPISSPEVWDLSSVGIVRQLSEFGGNWGTVSLSDVASCCSVVTFDASFATGADDVVDNEDDDRVASRGVGTLGAEAAFAPLVPRKLSSEGEESETTSSSASSSAMEATRTLLVSLSL